MYEPSPESTAVVRSDLGTGPEPGPFARPRAQLRQLRSQFVLGDQNAQFFNCRVQLVLVAEPPAAEKLHVRTSSRADEPQLLGADPGADLHAPAADKQRVQGSVGSCGVSAKSSMTTSAW